MTGKPCNYASYHILTQIVERLKEIPNLLETMQVSQFTGNNE